MPLNTISDLIRFVTDLFDDEFDYCIDFMPSRYYFLQGGCYELAQIIHHFFPESSYVIRKDGGHVAVMDQHGMIYDATVALNEVELETWGVSSCHTYSATGFEPISQSQLDLCSFGGWKEIRVEGKTPHEAVIQELYQIDTITIGGKSTFHK